MKVPDYKARALADGATPSGPVEQGLVDLLHGQPAPEAVVYANDIYEDPYKSEVVEAFILAGASADVIAEYLRIPAPVYESYKTLFFDRSVFKDELDVTLYVQTYPEDTKEQKWGKDLKLAATTLGLDYLVYRFTSKTQKNFDLEAALRQIIENSFMLTKATKLNPLDSNAARESRQWAATAVKALEAYVRVKPAVEATDDEFQVALESIERATNETKSGIKKEDIVH